MNVFRLYSICHLSLIPRFETNRLGGNVSGNEPGLAMVHEANLICTAYSRRLLNDVGQLRTH